MTQSFHSYVFLPKRNDNVCLKKKKKTLYKIVHGSFISNR